MTVPVTIPETPTSEGRATGDGNPAVEETHEDEVPDPDPDSALSYPTPESNPSNTPRLANEGLKHLHKLPSREPAHAVSDSAARQISLEDTSANQVEIHRNSQAAVLATADTPCDTEMRFSANGHDGTFQDDSAPPEPTLGFPFVTKPSYSPTVEDAEEISESHHNPGNKTNYNPSVEDADDVEISESHRNLGDKTSYNPTVEDAGEIPESHPNLDTSKSATMPPDLQTNIIEGRDPVSLETRQHRDTNRERPNRKRKLAQSSRAQSGKSLSKTLRLQESTFPGPEMDRRVTLESMFPKITPKIANEVRSRGDRLLQHNLPEFLEKHSTIWTTVGFWDVPSLTLMSPNAVSKDDGAGVFRYVQVIQAQEETNFVKLRLGRTLLYLHYIREVEWKRRSGVKESRVKSEAINSLLERIETAESGTGSLSLEARRKIRSSFHMHKRLAERWWWLACFIGPGAVLVCSEETGNKVLVLSNQPSLSVNRASGTTQTSQLMP